MSSSRVRVDVQSTTRVCVSPAGSSTSPPPAAYPAPIPAPIPAPPPLEYQSVECHYASPGPADIRRYSSREVRRGGRDLPYREPPRRGYSRETYDRDDSSRRRDDYDYEDDYDRRPREDRRPRKPRSRERDESPPRHRHHPKHHDARDVERSYKIYITRSQTKVPSAPSISSKSMVDQATLDKLEAGFKKLQDSKECHSLLKKYLTRDVFDRLKTRKTAMGATLLDVVQSGMENLDSGVGLYAPDAESYTLFADLFNPVIEDYHGGFKATDRHPPTDFGDVNTLHDLDPENKYVISTRVRCGRSLQGYPFNPCLTEAQYKEMEEKVRSTLSSLQGELKGTYYPLTGMDKKTQQQLIDDHFLFKEGDRFLQAANACRFWPTGRGIYHNDAKTFLVWCNEEDHLRIISMQKGGDLKTIYSRMVNAVKQIEQKLPFSRDDRLGYLTFCPTNLGTTIRASVHIKVPKLAADLKKLEGIAAKYNLQVRGTRGEHTESEGGVYDISNKRRLGLTEYQAVREMHDGILELIKMEAAA